MKPILFVTTGLTRGGAETVLVQILGALDRSVFKPHVICLGGRGVFHEVLEAKGIPVENLELNPRIPSPRALSKFRHLVKSINPAVIQGWMYHGNLMASWGAWLLSYKAPVFWSIHNSLYDLSLEKTLTRVLIRIGAKLSSGAAGIVYCAKSTASLHENVGYSKAASRIIVNGFDAERFKPDARSYAALRAELKIAPTTPLIGCVGRFHAQKDQLNFIKAAKIFAAGRPEPHFVIVGPGNVSSNPSIRALLESSEISSRMHLLGERNDVPTLYPAFDVFVNPSASEAFPLCVGEAMLSGVPCIATDVGDSSAIVGDAGLIVPPKNPQALAQALVKMCDLSTEEKKFKKVQAREYIEQRFALKDMVKNYENLYRESIS